MIKRFLRRPAALLLLLAVSVAQAAPRIATTDWSVAETLAAMQRPPVSVGDKRAYGDWVGEPPLPPQTLDAGLRFQPNLERLRQIGPDMFVQSSWFSHLKPQFERIAPVYEINFGTPQGIDYSHTVSTTRQLGKVAKAEVEAENLIAETERQLAQYRARLAPLNRQPLAVVQFADARHLRIYGRTSMYQAVLDKLGLLNAWQGASNEWGFANITLPDLAKLPPGTLLVIVKPYPPNVPLILEKSALWQRLPFAQAENRRILPPVANYGALPSMRHFARELVEKRLSEKEGAW